MKNIKIAFFDIDGTLVDMQLKKMTEATRQTLLALKARGIRLCIASGRTPITVPKFPGIDFDAYITFNGAYCYDEKGTIAKCPIPHEDVLRVIDNASRLGKPVTVATRDRLGANGWEKNLADYFRIANLELNESPEFDDLVKDDVYQIMVGTTPGEYDALLENAPGAKIAAWWDRAVDVIPAAGGKGAGVKSVLEHFGLKAEEAIAFGDGNNDLEMLEAVGTSVAMGNGSQDLKNIAAYVARPCAEDGIYHFCKEQGLIGDTEVKGK